MKTIASYNLEFKVGEGECKCGSKEAHCHIARDGCIVAKLFLNPVSIEPGHMLEPDEVQRVMQIATNNTYALLEGFAENRDFPKGY